MQIGSIFRTPTPLETSPIQNPHQVAMLDMFGDQSFVPVFMGIHKKTAVSHSCTEVKSISLSLSRRRTQNRRMTSSFSVVSHG